MNSITLNFNHPVLTTVNSASVKLPREVVFLRYARGRLFWHGRCSSSHLANILKASRETKPQLIDYKKSKYSDKCVTCSYHSVAKIRSWHFSSIGSATTMQCKCQQTRCWNTCKMQSGFSPKTRI